MCIYNTEFCWWNMLFINYSRFKQWNLVPSVKRTLNVITKQYVVISVANKFILNAMNLMT